MPKTKPTARTAKTKAPPKTSPADHKPKWSFAETFPAINYWVTSVGWIEMGDDDFSPTWIRALTMGGMVWESDDQTTTLDEALQTTETALCAWLDENESRWRKAK
jgi:hypothetical protein